MPFYLYTHSDQKYSKIRPISLAGNNVLHKAWDERGKPLNQGWHVGRDDIVSFAGGSPAENAVLIDLKPRSQESIDLYHLLDMWIYTYENREHAGAPSWSPLMLRLREALCRKLRAGESRKDLVESFRIAPDAYEGDVIEFLYVNALWNWGRTGQVNGVLLYKDALNFFLRQLELLKTET